MVPVEAGVSASRFPYAHTYSIVARDPHSGEMGVAVQSHWFSVGSLVTWAEAGVGAVATQAMVDPNYGPLGLALMRSGLNARQALQALLAADEGRDLRQVAMVDTKGNAAAHTGARCLFAAGHETGDGFSAQANMMVSEQVWPAMAAAYRQKQGSLADRLLSALKAGQDAGGDIRGQQSAAILVVKPESTGRVWADRVVELRVEDHPSPVDEIQRLWKLQRAYDLMNAGDEHLGAGRVEAALAAYETAAALAPEQIEMPFWHAVTLAGIGRIDDALPIFSSVFHHNPAWKDLVRRLRPAGMLSISEEDLNRILFIEV
jgi:uncharacterized Ntn-hydrolase superfamily protein